MEEKLVTTFLMMIPEDDDDSFLFTLPWDYSDHETSRKHHSEEGVEIKNVFLYFHRKRTKEREKKTCNDEDITLSFSLSFCLPLPLRFLSSSSLPSLDREPILDQTMSDS